MIRANMIVLSAVLMAPIGAATCAFTTPMSVVADEKTDSGTVKSYDAGTMSFVLTVGTVDKTIKVNRETKYTLDGKESTAAAALAAGNQATVRHMDGTATSVAASTKKPS